MVATLAVVLTAVVFSPPAAKGVPSAWFEIEGNTRSDGGLDWSTASGAAGATGLFSGGTFVDATTPPSPPTTTLPAGAVAAAFVVDPMGDDVNGPCGGDTVFTGQGSEKNGDAFSTMTFATSNVPPKDEITNAYGVSHLDGNVAELIFGGERVVNNGDSHLDFEFLQSPLTTSGACKGKLSGDRREGDLLVTVDFVNGGSSQASSLYEWVCPSVAFGAVCNPPQGSYVQVTDASRLAHLKVRVNATATACGGWICRDEHGAQATSIAANNFVEGVIDLGGLQSSSRACFATFLPHTRSAQQFTATLKDFAPPATLDMCLTPSMSTASTPTGGGHIAPVLSATDTASVPAGAAGPVTGGIDFYLCGPGQADPATNLGCAGGTKVGARKTVTSGSATSDAAGPLTGAGTYCWRAVFVPDGNSRYRTATHTNATSECFTTVGPPKANPGMSTNSSPKGAGQLAPVTATDTATLTASGPVKPTGTVAFYLCGPSEATATGCVAGTKVGTDKTVSTTGNATTATSDATGVLRDAGRYCWRAVYSGDTNFNAVSHTDGTDECFTIAPATPMISTTSSPTGGHVGTVSATDAASLGGAAGVTPTGTVDFFLCGPGQSDPVSAAGCDPGKGTASGVNKAIDANGNVSSDPSGALTAIGTYCWRVEYSGDAVYAGGGHTNATSECFTITDALPQIDVTKAASATVVHAGDAVTYTYEVKNPGVDPLTVAMADDKCAAVSYIGGDADNDAKLDPTETWTYSCTANLQAPTTNVVTATGTDPQGNVVRDTAEATVAVIRPVIAIDKSADAASVAPGATVVYRFVVTNPGDVALSGVNVDDDKCAPVTVVGGDANGDGLLQVDESWTFRCSQVHTGAADLATNIGTAVGTDPLGLVVSAQDRVTIAIVAPAIFERPAPAPAPPPVPAPVPVADLVTLPRTGIDVAGWLQLGGSLVLLGVTLLAVGRRRPRRATPNSF